MANRYYGAEFGANNAAQVTEGGSSTAGLDVEIRITYDATANNKLAALIAIDACKQAILKDTWPPA